MNQNIFFGLILISLGAFSSGSFAIPFGKIMDWKWESYWMIFSLETYIIFLLTACSIFSPDLPTVVPSMDTLTPI